MSARLWVTCLVGLLCLFGCESFETGSSSESLVGGFDDDGTPPRFPGAVMLLGPPRNPAGDRELCSGVLIGPSHVLTSAHCMRDWAIGTYNVHFGFHPIELDPGVLFPDIDGAGTSRVVDCARHPDYVPDGTTVCGPTTGCSARHDLAVLGLANPIPAAWAPAVGGRPNPVAFHRVLDSSEAAMVAVMDRAARVAYGPQSFGNLATAGYRRYEEQSIIALEFGGIPAVRFERGGATGGDSGSPILWLPGATTDPPWGEPVIGVTACASASMGSAGDNTSLLDPANLGFVLGRLDTNGDGRFDYGGTRVDNGLPWGCDGNKGFSLTSRAANDPDGDGYIDATDDNHPGVFNPCQIDSDGDGWGNNFDNCPAVFNPSQTNSDTDRLGDACDNCDFVDNPGQEDVDVVISSGGEFDENIGDGFGDACDLCPDQIDREQSDCNHDATAALRAREAAAGLPLTPFRGDACDPDPCGETEIRTSTEYPSGVLATERISMDRVVVDGLADLEDGASIRGRTTFRFCPCDVAVTRADMDVASVRERCAMPIHGGCDLLDLDAQRATVEALPWLWTTHELVDEPLPPTPPRPHGGPPLFDIELDPEVVVTYDAPTASFRGDYTTRWRMFEDDVPRWVTSGFVPASTIPPASGAQTGLPGVFWTHTPGEEGAPDYPDAQRQLRSHFWSGEITSPVLIREPFPCIQPVTPFLGGGIGCPFCVGHFPTPWVGFGSLSPRCPGLLFERPLLVLGPIQLEPGIELGLDGLEHFANDPGPWIAAAETGSWLEGDGFRYVKMLDGVTLDRTLIQLGVKLSDPGNVPGPFVTALPATPVGPVPRDGAFHVLSARRATLFVFGGVAQGSGEVLDDAWAFSLGRGEWNRLSWVDEDFGDVLAVTYSAADDSIYLLDRTGERRRDTVMRLYRLGPEGGATTMIGQWSQQANNEHYMLSAAPDGALWLAASPRGASTHAVARLVILGDLQPEASGWEKGPGALLAGGARASERGITVAVERGMRGPEIVAYGVDELRDQFGWAREFF